jgi:hypothetical protein
MIPPARNATNMMTARTNAVGTIRGPSGEENAARGFDYAHEWLHDARRGDPEVSERMKLPVVEDELHEAGRNEDDAADERHLVCVE